MSRLYGIWVFLTFLGTFFLLFPAYYVFLSNPKWNRSAHKITWLWGKVVFFLSGIRPRIRWDFDFDKNQTYIFCPNHFSYSDIPLMVFSLPGFYKFVGKRSLEKIPFFGYMYKRLYILVERSSRVDSYKALQACLDALDKGISIVIFPEGGILSKEIPKMTRFKDGAFRMGIEKGIPIVPVSIPRNWIFLPDKRIQLEGLPLKIRFHEPIETKNLRIEDLAILKERTRKIIQDALEEELK